MYSVKTVFIDGFQGMCKKMFHRAIAMWKKFRNVIENDVAVHYTFDSSKFVDESSTFTQILIIKQEVDIPKETEPKIAIITNKDYKTLLLDGFVFATVTTLAVKYITRILRIKTQQQTYLFNIKNF